MSLLRGSLAGGHNKIRMERALGVGTTVRNWPTCQRILKRQAEIAA